LAGEAAELVSGDRFCHHQMRCGLKKQKSAERKIDAKHQYLNCL
jgi:hypothetical protein